jgi:hypothetical protein
MKIDPVEQKLIRIKCWGDTDRFWFESEQFHDEPPLHKLLQEGWIVIHIESAYKNMQAILLQIRR